LRQYSHNPPHIKRQIVFPKWESLFQESWPHWNGYHLRQISGGDKVLRDF
jgi:hypothetical protein